jgi:uncharacterized phage protein (TIGR02220 family)
MAFLARFSDKPETKVVEGITVTINKYEFIFGRPAWCRRLDISEQRMKTLLKKMIAEGFIKQTQTCNKFTVYSFEYGSLTNQQINQLTNQQDSKNQPAETRAPQGIEVDANQQKIVNQPTDQPTDQPKKEKGIKEQGSKEEGLKPIRGETEMAMTEEAKGILAYLNEKKGSKYRPTPNTLKLIQGRLNEGYTIEDCKYVIDVKISHWLGTKDEKYLDYETLFRPSKFPKYLEQKPGQVEQIGYQTKSQRTSNVLDQAMKELSGNESGRRDITDEVHQYGLPEFRG